MFYYLLSFHSSEIGGLCLMKWPSKILQNLPYFYRKKPHTIFSDFHFKQVYFFPNEFPGLCWHRPGHSLGEKNLVAQDEKQKETTWVFLWKKYCKFWMISLGHFIKHKPPIYEECFLYVTNPSLCHFFKK